MQKTILLSPCEQSTTTGRGILTIDYNNEILVGKLRLYNLSINPMQSKIGAYINGRVYKADLQTVEKNLYSFKISNIHLKFDELYFALVENSVFLLCGGNYSDSIVNIKDYFKTSEKQIKQPLYDNETDTEQVDQINKNNTAPSYDEIAQKDMEDFFLQKEMIDRLREMEYKKDDQEFDENLYKKETIPTTEMIDSEETYQPTQDRTRAQDQQMIHDPATDPIRQRDRIQTPSQDQQRLQDYEMLDNPDQTQIRQQDQIRDPAQDQQQVQEHKQNSSGVPFLDNINDQIQELLENYPPEKQLENIIPDAKFVRINDNEADNYYVLGVIYQNDKIKYIAYGVPGTFNSEPPAELQDKSQWLPLDVEDPLSDGYYLIYQDANTGNLVDLEVK